MKKIITLSIFITLTLVSTQLFASIDRFQQKMNSIVISAERNKEVVGIQVVSLNRGDTLYAHNQNRPLNPASCAKLLTSATALKLLGPNYRFHTKFYTDYRPVGGKVGSLWVKGFGDPSIVIERLWRMTRDLSNAGLREIDGDIVIDDYYFSSYEYPGYTKGSSRAYNSLTGAASLNFNTITIVVSPSSRVGLPPLVSPDTAGPYFRIRNSAKTGPRGSKNTLSVIRTTEHEEDILIVKGNIPVSSPPRQVFRNISNPPLYFGLALKSLLQQNGIKVKGDVRRGRTPSSIYLLLDSISKPLSLIVRDMNKYSNNFIAEQLTKTLAAEIGNTSGNTREGINVVANYLNHLEIPPKSYSLVNGSGLTRNNRVTASTLVTVIAHMFADPRISHEAISSLSIAGVDGTTRDRHKDKSIKGIARAKTGTLSGVSTLTGIIPARNGETLGYAILMNGNALPWEESHKIQEAMLSAMSSFNR